MKITTNNETTLLIFSISANVILGFQYLCKVFKVAHACTVTMLCTVGFVLDFVGCLWLTGFSSFSFEREISRILYETMLELFHELFLRSLSRHATRPNSTKSIACYHNRAYIYQTSLQLNTTVLR